MLNAAVRVLSMCRGRVFSNGPWSIPTCNLLLHVFPSLTTNVPFTQQLFYQNEPKRFQILKKNKQKKLLKHLNHIEVRTSIKLYVGLKRNQWAFSLKLQIVQSLNYAWQNNTFVILAFGDIRKSFINSGIWFYQFYYCLCFWTKSCK